MTPTSVFSRASDAVRISPLANTFPTTCSSHVGSDVPIPTFELHVITPDTTTAPPTLASPATVTVSETFKLPNVTLPLVSVTELVRVSHMMAPRTIRSFANRDTPSLTVRPWESTAVPPTTVRPPCTVVSPPTTSPFDSPVVPWATVNPP